MANVTMFLPICLLLFIGINTTSGQDFGYDGHVGPVHWGEKFQQCRGKHQSPININILRVKDVILPELKFVGFDDQLDNVHMTNNGHTVTIEVENEPHPRVSGGPLDGDYIFSQMHFHWGDNDTFGSEDLLNSRSYPMELHMVFYKSTYATNKKAMEYKDGLAVLAFFYEVDRRGHPAYDSVNRGLFKVQEPKTSIKLDNPFDLFSLLPYDLRRYFTYKGSLTTPPCSEVVTWIDFEQPIRLEHAQFEAFRELRSTYGKLRHNFRPVQPLGDRKIYYNSERYYYQVDEEGHRKKSSAVRQCIPYFNLFVTLIFCYLIH